MKVFAAMDADGKRLEPLLELAKRVEVQIEMAPTREVLGRACAISRGASIAGILKV
jgi:ribosomal protein L7Ae-like RNA K-turn-binding protein